MTNEEFLSLKDGDKVLFNPDPSWTELYPDGFVIGAVLTRKSSWLDCDLTRNFEIGDEFDYLNHNEVELIRE
jgi:hypothetical protein